MTLSTEWFLILFFIAWQLKHCIVIFNLTVCRIAKINSSRYKFNGLYLSFVKQNWFEPANFQNRPSQGSYVRKPGM